MSIEKDVQECTAAIHALIAVLTAGTAKASGAAPAADVKAPAAKAPAAETTEALTFDVLKPRFLALVKKNRATAEGILATLGITKLTEAKLPQYPDVDKALKAAGV